MINYFRLSDATGEMLFTLISKKCIRKSDLDPMDGLLHQLSFCITLNSKIVFIVDTGKNCFVWIGSGASGEEKRLAMQYAHVSMYLVFNLYYSQ